MGKKSARCAINLRERIDRWLPKDLQEAVVVPDDLRCDREIVIVNGPSGAGKSEFLRHEYQNFVTASVDNLQYTGPCKRRLQSARSSGYTSNVDACTDLGVVVSKIVLREGIKSGANLAFETTRGIHVPDSYHAEYVLVYRKFEEAYNNVIERHTDMAKDVIPWAVKEYPTMHAYLDKNFIPNMFSCIRIVTSASELNPRIYNASGNRRKETTVASALKELSRAFVFLSENHHPKKILPH